MTICTKNPGICFFFCIESGYLEHQALLLARSISCFGGFAAESTLYAVQPRPGPPIDRSVRSQLTEPGVEVLPSPEGEAFTFPRLNKVRVAAWIEHHANEDIVVFLDTDTIFVAPPMDLRLDTRFVVGVRPVDSKNIGSTGPADPLDHYWQRAYDLCGCSEPPWVETAVGREQIRGYWNSGLVAARRKSSTFQTWLENLNLLVDHDHLPPAQYKEGVGIPFTDQVALSVTLGCIEVGVRTLPWSYNYCLPKRSLMISPMANAPWEELVHIHYHSLFSESGALKDLRPRLPADNRYYSWLQEQLPVPSAGTNMVSKPTLFGVLRQRIRVKNASSRKYPAFFVVGTGRCGTNLLRNILNVHPKVHVVRESHWLPVLLDRFGDRPAAITEQLEVVDNVFMAKGMTAFERIAGFNKLTAHKLRKLWIKELSPLDRVTPRELMIAFYRLMARLNRVDIVGDKTPEYGFCMQRLSRIWPGARFVHIVRDGRDVALSMSDNLTFRRLAQNGEMSWTNVAFDRKFIARQSDFKHDTAINEFFSLWQRRLSAIRAEAGKLDNHLYLEIRYEDLLTDPGEPLRRLKDFLQLPEPGPWPGQGSLERARCNFWERRAARLVKPNLNKNTCTSEYRNMTEQFNEELEQLGFNP